MYSMTEPKLSIVSGGQTGVDRAALDWAIKHEIPHGGWCHEGRMAEDGVIGVVYQLLELPGGGYRQRTKANVKDSDATLIVSMAPTLSGVLPQGFREFLFDCSGGSCIKCQHQYPVGPHSFRDVLDQPIDLSLCFPSTSRCYHADSLRLVGNDIALIRITRRSE